MATRMQVVVGRTPSHRCAEMHMCWGVTAWPGNEAQQGALRLRLGTVFPARHSPEAPPAAGSACVWTSSRGTWQDTRCTFWKGWQGTCRTTSPEHCCHMNVLCSSWTRLQQSCVLLKAGKELNVWDIVTRHTWHCRPCRTHNFHPGVSGVTRVTP